MTVWLEVVCALVVLLVLAGAYVGLRLHHERQIKSWIDAGLLVRKPNEFVRQSRYHW